MPGSEKYGVKQQVRMEDRRNSEDTEICEQTRIVRAVFQRRKTRQTKSTYTCWNVEYGYTLKKIADHVVIYYTTVSKAVKRFDEK